MTISKEERAEWRKEHMPWHGMSPGSDSATIIRLLDALEAAEARAEAIENRADEVISDLIDSHRNMEVRAEAAERERDVLAKRIGMYTMHCHAASDNCCPHREKTCDICWLEWARQQARGEEK